MNATAIRTVALAHGWWEASPIGGDHLLDTVWRRKDGRGHYIRLFVYHDATGHIDSLIACYSRPYREQVILLDDIDAFLKEAK